MKYRLENREVENVDPLVVTDSQKNPASLRDLWKGCSGFLVGGGPSIDSIDYKRLGDRGIVSLAINNVAGKVPVSMFTCSDPAEKFHHGIWMDPSLIKFVPTPRLRDKIRVKRGGTFCSTKIRVRDCPNVWAYQRDCNLKADEFLTRPSASWGRNNEGVKELGGPKLMQTFLLGLRLMHYLGVRRTYLIGVDFSVDYAFSQEKRSGAEQFGALNHYLEMIKPTIDRSGMEVLNCNPESGLKLWPTATFDEALNDCRRFVPDGEFDLQGWYEKKQFDENYRDGQTG